MTCSILMFFVPFELLYFQELLDFIHFAYLYLRYSFHKNALSLVFTDLRSVLLFQDLKTNFQTILPESFSFWHYSATSFQGAVKFMGKNLSKYVI